MDASDSHVGAVLQHRIDEAWFPLAFFSRKLSDAEKKYSAFERELQAAYLSIRQFCFMLEGREFLLFSNHKPLTSALFRSSPPWTARQQSHLAYQFHHACSRPGEYRGSCPFLPYSVLQCPCSIPTPSNHCLSASSKPSSTAAPNPSPTEDSVPVVSAVTEGVSLGGGARFFTFFYSSTRIFCSKL